MILEGFVICRGRGAHARRHRKQAGLMWVGEGGRGGGRRGEGEGRGG